jgi:hypothetical protein
VSSLKAQTSNICIYVFIEGINVKYLQLCLRWRHKRQTFAAVSSLKAQTSNICSCVFVEGANVKHLQLCLRWRHKCQTFAAVSSLKAQTATFAAVSSLKAQTSDICSCVSYVSSLLSNVHLPSKHTQYCKKSFIIRVLIELRKLAPSC